jgi:uncharacterized membrane protein
MLTITITIPEIMVTLHPSRCVKCGGNHSGNSYIKEKNSSTKCNQMFKPTFARVIILLTIKVVLNINYFLNVAKQPTCYHKNKNIILTSSLIKPLFKAFCASIISSNNILLPNRPMDDISFSRFFSGLLALINLILSLLLLL